MFVSRRRKDKEEGIALVLVLVFLAFFSILVSDFLYRARLNTYLTFNQTEQVRARFLAEAGLSSAEGLLLHSAPFTRNYRGNFQNQFINLFECTCYSVQGLFGFQKQERESEQSLGGECGEWKLVLDWPIEEDTIHLEISDETARLNLNALVKKSMGGEGAEEYTDYKHIVSELIKFRLNELGFDVSDEEIDGLVELIIDWLDWGEVSGRFDHDFNEYYQDGDRIYSNKNGPMDSVSELRMIPGVNEEIYYALKDFFTVYPLSTDGENFLEKVNINLAPLAVVYALIRGTSYQGDNPTIDEEEALGYAQEIIESGIDENGFLKNRQIPDEIKNQPFNFKLNADMPQTRYYHILSSALTSSGVNYTIEAVMMIVPGSSKPRYLYWREG